MDAFLNIWIAIWVTVIITYIIRLLKQPLIIWYILSGIVLWPYFLNFLHNWEIFETFSQIWISLLLFIVWIWLNAKMIKETWKASLITWLWQVAFTSIIWFLIAKLLGFGNMEAIYICVALTFSSTIIIMKLLTDKWDAGSLYGKIAIWFLIVQDIVAAIMLMMISSLWWWEQVVSTLIVSMLKWVILITTAILIWIYVLPRFINNIAKSQEFLLLFSIAWCIVIAWVFHYFDFSMEIWALVAGITLSFSPMRYEISAKMKTLRDFFLVIFFIVLWSHMWFITSTQHILTIVILSVFILIWNPLIVIFLMWRLWYDSRSGFMAWLTVAQISEFSIILIALWIKTWHLSSDILSIVVTIWLITIVGSTYMIMYSDQLYKIFKKSLKRFEKKVGAHGIKNDSKVQSDWEIIVFGCHRMWSDLLKYTNQIKQDLLIIDYNPLTVKSLQQQNYNAIYWDLQDWEFLDDLDMSQTKMIISTVPDFEANALLIKTIKQHKGLDPIIITTSHEINQTLELYEMWSTYVITPYFLWWHYISKLIQEHWVQKHQFIKEAQLHKHSIQSRKS